jgi:lysozyme
VNPRMVVASLSLSGAGLIGIALHESWRDTAYLPTANDVPTIGFGSTEGVKLGDKITVERGLIKLKEDASDAEQAVRKCAPVPMHQHEFDAWVSFTFNVGGSAFCRSTAAKLLNEGKYLEACAQMDRWVYQGRNVLPGLVKRRAEERQLCEGKK